MTTDAQSFACAAFLRGQAGAQITGEERSALADHAALFGRRMGWATEEDRAEFPFLLPEQRTMSSQIPQQGGYTVDAGLLGGTIARALQKCSPVRRLAEVITTPTGAPFVWPTANDADSEGELIGEGSTRGQGDVTLGQVRLSAYTFTSKILVVPRELLEDLGPGMLAGLWTMLGERVARIQNRYFTLGTGGSQPQGCVAGATAGRTAASATAISYDDVVELIYSVDAAYRDGAVFQGHSSILKALAELKSGTGEPVLEDMGGPAPTVLGFPFVPNLHMDSTIASGKKTLLFGQASSYKIRDVREAAMVLIQEEYAEKD